MLKRIALLISLVMIFSLSFVFATEEAQNTLLIAPAPTTGAIDNVTDEDINQEVSGEVTNNVSSGETVSGEDNVLENDTTIDTDEHTHNNGSSTTLGAVIAIVIVVAVVAIVAVLQKK